MDALSRHSRSLTIALLALAFAVRLGAASWWQSRLPAGQQFGFGDSHTYWMLAESVARGGPYQYGAGGPLVFRTPGYPFLMAPLFWLRASPPVMWARIEGAVLGTLAVGGTIWLARRLFSPGAGVLAGGLAAVYPGTIGASVFVLSEAPYCPLLIAQLCCWVGAWTAASRQTLTTAAVLGGLAGGAATLVRPSHLLFTPFALALAMLAGDRRRNLVIGALMLSALAATMLPWWIRNYRVTGRFVATTLQMGASLYDGLNPHATGASDMRFVDEFVAAQRQSDAVSTVPPAGTFESRLDERFRSAAVAWLKDNPVRVSQLVWSKFWRMWNPLPNAAEFQSRLFRLVTFVGYSPLLVLAMWGTWRYWSGGWPYRLCLVPAVYLTLLHLVFVSSIRYREPAMLPLIVLAAGVWYPSAQLPSSAQLPLSRESHVST